MKNIIVIGISVFVAVFLLVTYAASVAYKLGQDKGRLTFFEELYQDKITCEITSDVFTHQKID